MVCIYCGSKTTVTNSRTRKPDVTTWRRRTCIACHATTTTEEAVVLSGALRIKKRNGTIEPFSRDKLFISVYQAVGHLDNPAILASELTATILRHCYKTKPLDPIIASSHLSKITSLVLKRYNAAASVRYLSYQTELQLPRDIQRSFKK